MISSQNVTANFIPPPTTVALTFPVGANPTPQEAVFACPSNTNPCMDPSAHALQLTIPNVNSTVNVTVLATEVPPSQADGLCESGNSVTNDFDCRFVTFFSDGTDANNNVIVPLCDPYANGNCVHYLVYSTAGGPGVEPPASSYSGGVYWQITWNNESFTPPAPYWSSSTPQLYDDPDYPVSQTAPYGTNCSPSTPMFVGITNPQATNPPIYCQFEFNITEFYNPTQTVDSGIGGSTKQFNDVVVAFPPTVAGTNPVVQPPTPSTPAITGTCLTGCSIAGAVINFTVGTGGTFQAVPTGYPAPTLTESGALPNGLTINKLTGIVGGTPAPGSNGTYSISFTATNSVNSVTQTYMLIVGSPAPPPTFTVTVTELGTGTGQVTDGINLDCMEANGITTGTCSGTYAANSMVTFTANPTAPTTFGGWGGACASFGTNTPCTLTISSSQNVTANFVPPPTPIALTFPVGTNPPPQEAVFNCPSNTNPCMDPSAHALQLTIPNVSATVAVTVLATEVPPSQANGLCGSTNNVTNDFDCRFVTFFSDGTDANNNTIVPLCDPYANGNCVHYLVYSTSEGPGVEPPASSYSGGVYWQITWNNESFTPPGPYYLGSTPQLYDDPDYAPTPGSSVGTSCTQPMTINGVNQSYSCQFEFNITEFYDPTQTVDSGIGGSTKQFNDVVVAFPPTVAGTNPIVQPPTQSTPAITATCLTGCTISGSTINFSVGTGGTFQVVPTGYPAPKLTESGSLPNGITMNKLTGILSGTPTTAGSSTVMFTATNSTGASTQSFTLAVHNRVPTITTLSPTSATAGAAAQPLTINGTNFLSTSTVTYNGVAHTPTFVSAVKLTIPLTTGDQATAGTFPVVVTNPMPGGGASNSVSFTVNNLVPTITTLSPTSATAGAAAQTLTINGTNFVSTSTVTYNGVLHTATFASAAKLTIQLTTGDQATAGTFPVIVTNPAPGGGTSNSLSFTVNNLAPTITTLSPTSATAGAAAQALTINGTNFVSTSTVTYNDVAHTAAFVSSVKLTIQLTAGDQATAGTFPVVVTNPMPGGGASNSVSFTVNNLVPTITTLSPTSATAGAAAQTLTINGTNFVSTSTVTYNGVAHTATFVSAVKLTIQLTAGDQATGGNFPVKVTNPAPGGGTSNSVNFTVNQPPAITSANTTTFTVGTAGNFTVTASGFPAPTFSETGTLPSNVTLSSAGVLSGTPAANTGGTYKITITASNGISPNATQSFTLIVNSGATLKIAPTSVNFGTVYLDQIGAQFVTLTNTGTAPITISSIKITTPGNALGDFGEITVCSPFIPSMPGALAAGKTCTIAVGFLASAKIFSPTVSTATITINDNAAGSPQLIPLSLTVINPQASLSATNLSFATQKVGTTSAAKTVTLTNTGNTPLTLGTLTISGNFALASGSGVTCSNNGTVAAGASCAINVTFKPTAKGNNTGSVKIIDNALSSPQSISLSGTGN
jgi:Abnormal spindle-like microcephaly-assoc'd, ASPM-SPD-2-Hydin/Putative Ig domain